MKIPFSHTLLVASLLGGGALFAFEVAAQGADKTAINAIREEIVGTKTSTQEISLPAFESSNLVTGTRPLEEIVPSAPKSDDDLKKRLAELAEAEKSLEAKLTSRKSEPAAPVVKEAIVQPKTAPAAAESDARAKLSVTEKKETPKKESKVSSVIAEVTSLEQSRAKLQKELGASQANSRRLAGELDEMRSRLMIAETEVERLSALLEEKNATKLRSLNVPTRRLQAVPRESDLESLHNSETVVQEKMTADMPVATVVAEKAHLRTAPGEENSPLMTVSEGTRLAVETRQGGWLRVITPTGSRAWISSSVVTFGRGKSPPKMSEGSASEGNGEAEDRAFQSLQSGLH